MVCDELPFWSNGVGVTNGKRDRLYLYHNCTNRFEPLTGPMYQLENYALSDDNKKLLYIGSEFKGVQSLKQELVEVDLKPKQAPC